jgi:enoyl-CoA hydratase
MPVVIYEKDGRIARITLNRPEVMNAINDELPVQLADAVAHADEDPDIHVMVLAGNGSGFCAGYDLAYYAEGNGAGEVTQRCRGIRSRITVSCGATRSISCRCGEQ